MKKQLHWALVALFIFSSTAGAAQLKTESPAAPATECDTEEHCAIKCTDPHAPCDESKKVIEILQKLIGAYSQGDLDTYEKYLDDSCMLFVDNNKRIISGKSEVLAALKEHFAEHAPGGKKPLKSFHIDQPFAKVSDQGDTCAVTFVATKEVGGSAPHLERANVTDVFVKRGSGWKKLIWQGTWEPVVDN